ncbi:KUP/HAK/KT family potassium transporter [Undibacterium sp.]|uniref:KUP/HAK/KT family potassium transporter n=1 Tax=Undibacterium sp. TaxID=1914977 RepID=UPI0039C956E8
MERPDIPSVLVQAVAQGCRIQIDDVVYYEKAFFAAMERNAVHVTDFFRLPSDGVVEIGRQIAI